MKQQNTPTSHPIVKSFVFILFFGLTHAFAAMGAAESDALGNGAPQSTNNEKPLDVVLVMDSSGSMKKTDPQDLRKPAAKLFISLLGKDDRASVVSFSDQGYPVAFLTPVKGDKNQQRLFNAVGKISTKGGSTNLHGAIEAANRVLDKSKREGSQRIIVLMSDGKMDLGDTAQTEQLTQQLLTQTLPALKRQGVEVHTIAFTSQSDQALLAKIAEASGGKFNMAPTDKELHDAYTAIFEQNKSPNMLPFNGERFTIDKAIKEVTIVGSKESADVVLSLITPDNRMLSAEDTNEKLKWFVSQQFDLITITAPMTGEWKIKASSGRNKAYVITDLKQQVVVEPEQPEINEGVLIKTWLEEKGEILNKPSIIQSLVVELHVDTPEGDTHVLPMDPELSEDGIPTDSGVYNTLVALPTQGQFKFRIVASASTFSREKNNLVTVIPPVEAEPAAPEEPMTQAEPETAQQPMETPEPETTKQEEPPETPANKPMQAEKPEKPEQPPVAETKPATKKKDKKEVKDKKKPTRKKPADKDKEAGEEEGGNSKILIAIMIFVGINALLGGIGGGIYFFIRKRRAGGSDDESEDDAEAGENKDAQKANQAA